MRKLRFMLEYNCEPVWVLDGNMLVSAGLPDDLAGNAELAALTKEISAEYDSAFVNTPVEFSYKGFPDEEAEAAFEKKLVRAIELLRKEAEGRYTVKIERGLEKELSYLTD
jgi:hypothetical protein